MIRVLVSKKDNNIIKVDVLGHADYDQYGKDIVCSSVSSIVTTTVNAILMFDKNYLSYSEKKDDFEIVIKENNEIVDNLINNMINLLRELNEDYPDNIEIEEEE